MPARRTGCTFHGRVQGVGFRFTTRLVASGFAVTGWVRNEPDGTVRLEVQGDGPEVEAFLAALHERMAGNIDRVDRNELAVEPDESGFEIRR